MKLIHFFLSFENCVLYGLDTEPEPELKPYFVKSRNRNRKK